MNIPRPPLDAERTHRRASRCRNAGVVGVVVGATLAVAGCGSSRAPVILNTEQVQLAIEHSALAQRGKYVTVNCPSGVHQQKGLVFSCTAEFRGGSAVFVVTELDNAGDVHYESP